MFEDQDHKSKFTVTGQMFLFSYEAVSGFLSRTLLKGDLSLKLQLSNSHNYSSLFFQVNNAEVMLLFSVCFSFTRCFDFPLSRSPD